MCYIPPKISGKIPKVAVRYMYLVEESLMNKWMHFYIANSFMIGALCFDAPQTIGGGQTCNN